MLPYIGVINMITGNITSHVLQNQCNNPVLIICDLCILCVCFYFYYIVKSRILKYYWYVVDEKVILHYRPIIYLHNRHTARESHRRQNTDRCQKYCPIVSKTPRIINILSSFIYQRMWHRPDGRDDDQHTAGWSNSQPDVYTYEQQPNDYL